MAKSIIQDTKECYVTKSRDGLHEHHIFAGSNRKNSERYGLKVYLIPLYHTGPLGVHSGNKGLNSELKQLAQRKFEEIHGHDKFMQVFRKNYL